MKNLKMQLIKKPNYNNSNKVNNKINNNNSRLGILKQLNCLKNNGKKWMK